MTPSADSRTDRPGNPDEKSQPLGEKDSILIAAIGASAGGIEAFTDLLKFLPPDTGIAFVLIQHLDPKHHSILAELLARKTEMAVEEVSDGVRVQPNHVYVIPPNTIMSISDDILHLGPREAVPRPNMPIDHLMRALAEQKGHRAIGVILSGSGTDGTLGMGEIQAHGGVTFAQDEASAKYDSMPRSVVAAGYADHVLPPQGIAAELARIARHPYVAHSAKHVSAGGKPSADQGMSAIFQMLRKNTGVDFANYRQTTIQRRVQRRMMVHKIEKIEEYVRYVQSHPAEVQSLYQEMLITVTSFFRSPQVFDALKSRIFPAILKNGLSNRGLRVWTPGCSSGEETYSVAISLLEVLGEKTSQFPIQFFGSDLSEQRIRKARSGTYPRNIQGDVSAERLRRFFTEVESGYRVSKSIRDMCLFAQHNVLNDPPFSEMDLICCRNLLIYLEGALQSKLISLFHHALRPNGFLVLGPSEGLGVATTLFATEDRANKIFSKKATAVRLPVAFSYHPAIERGEHDHLQVSPRQADASWNYSEAQKEFDRRLLMQHTPATVFINEDGEIIHTRGNVSAYLKIASGRPSLDLMKMVREGLQLELRSAISRARKENTTVARRNLRIKDGNGGDPHAPAPARWVNFEVIPITLSNLKQQHLMIIFQDAPPRAPVKVAVRRSAADLEEQAASGRLATVEQELAATREYLQSVIETQEAVNEELQSANEEILSSNEELQSTNEELGTAKEELQSTNEELITVNDELRSRNLEVTQINNDLMNLLSSTDIAVIMVGSDVTVRRYTPKAQKFLGLIPGDIGRPLRNVSTTFEIADLHSMAMRVMADFHTLEKELTDKQGVRYQLKVLPYRTLDNKIDGAVITIVDIAPVKPGSKG